MLLGSHPQLTVGSSRATIGLIDGHCCDEIGPCSCTERLRVYRQGMIGGPQLLIILAIALLLFGGSKLPKLARSLGQAQTEFRKGVSDVEGLPDSAADPKA